MPPEADAEGLARGVAGIWWDSGQIEIPTRPLFDRLLKLQPKLISNGRIQSGRHHVPGVTFGTPEQELGAFKLSEPWESCVTMMGENWFWNGGQDIRSAESCIRLLVNCAIGDGNLLLDFGPDVLGRIHPKVKENFKQIGQWLGQFSQSVRGTRGGPFMPDQWGGSTRSGNTIYLHILQTWTGRQLRLPPLPRKIVAAKVLTGGRAVVAQTEDGITLEIDPAQHPRLDTIVALEVDGSAMELKP
ncbi:MAG TPA: alpha-L-fucosidase, partial [Candidatus Sulfotelmatobacter sp.]|nr:alpha-L-fucosidase [Candidatus Sulfotelmatobacter sp.]